MRSIWSMVMRRRGSPAGHSFTGIGREMSSLPSRTRIPTRQLVMLFAIDHEMKARSGSTPAR